MDWPIRSDEHVTFYLGRNLFVCFCCSPQSLSKRSRNRFCPVVWFCFSRNGDSVVRGLGLAAVSFPGMQVSKGNWYIATEWCISTPRNLTQPNCSFQVQLFRQKRDTREQEKKQSSDTSFTTTVQSTGTYVVSWVTSSSGYIHLKVLSFNSKAFVHLRWIRCMRSLTFELGLKSRNNTVSFSFFLMSTNDFFFLPFFFFALPIDLMQICGC